MGDERERIIADALPRPLDPSAVAREFRLGQARNALAALEAHGYRVVRQEKVGWWWNPTGTYVPLTETLVWRDIEEHDASVTSDAEDA